MDQRFRRCIAKPAAHVGRDVRFGEQFDGQFVTVNTTAELVQDVAQYWRIQYRIRWAIGSQNQETRELWALRQHRQQLHR